MCVELALRQMHFVRQAPFHLLYKGAPVGEGRLDLLVDERLVVELKAVARLASVHLAQVLSYPKALRQPLGHLINFNVAVVRGGVRRVVLSP